MDPLGTSPGERSRKSSDMPWPTSIDPRSARRSGRASSGAASGGAPSSPTARPRFRHQDLIARLHPAEVLREPRLELRNGHRRHVDLPRPDHTSHWAPGGKDPADGTDRARAPFPRDPGRRKITATGTSGPWAKVTFAVARPSPAGTPPPGDARQPASTRLPSPIGHLVAIGHGREETRLSAQHLKVAHPHPALVKHAEERAKSLQNRIADRITRFAGSMNFVYLHVALFIVWMTLLEGSPGRRSRSSCRSRRSSCRRSS